MTPRAAEVPLRITALLPRPNEGSLGTPSWKSASVRLRCASIAPHLGARGAAVRMVASSNAARRVAEGSFFDSDIYVIYQTQEDHRPIVSALIEAGKCVVADVCDDVALYRGVLARTWENAQRAAAITVPTRSLAARLARRIHTPIHVVPDAVEGQLRAMRPPRPDGPLRLFWYGWQHKIGVLRSRIPVLAALARRRPLELAIMTNLDPVGPALRQILGASDGQLTIHARPWRLADFDEQMEGTDIAVIPYDDSVAYSGRSPIRLMQAVWQGRLAISEDVEGYPQFEPFGLLHRSVVDGIAWAVDHPEAAARGLAEAQRYVAETHRPDLLAGTWLRVLTEIHRGFAAGAAR